MARTYSSYARYWVEAFRLQDLTRAELDAGLAVDGFEHIEAALAAGKGAITVQPHLGGWEFAGAWFAARGFPLTVVVEPLSPPALFEWFVALRERMGFTVVPLGPDAGSVVARALAANQVVCLLTDRDITVRGAVSIGRRLMDPLADLVKIDAKSIGVGQYQHDVSQPLLARKLDEIVESCVNQVGVEVNTASAFIPAKKLNAVL